MAAIKAIRLIEQAMDLMTQARAEVMAEEQGEQGAAAPGAAPQGMMQAPAGAPPVAGATPIHSLEDLANVKAQLQAKRAAQPLKKGK